ncbi:unnamed protein product, partial [Protopolystoma xenopodis]
ANSEAEKSGLRILAPILGGSSRETFSNFYHPLTHLPKDTHFSCASEKPLFGHRQNEDVKESALVVKKYGEQTTKRDMKIPNSWVLKKTYQLNQKNKSQHDAGLIELFQEPYLKLPFTTAPEGQSRPYLSISAYPYVTPPSAYSKNISKPHLASETNSNSQSAKNFPIRTPQLSPSCHTCNSMLATVDKTISFPSSLRYACIRETQARDYKSPHQPSSKSSLQPQEGFLCPTTSRVDTADKRQPFIITDVKRPLVSTQICQGAHLESLQQVCDSAAFLALPIAESSLFNTSNELILPQVPERMLRIPRTTQPLQTPRHNDLPSSTKVRLARIQDTQDWHQLVGTKHYWRISLSESEQAGANPKKTILTRPDACSSGINSPCSTSNVATPSVFASYNSCDSPCTLTAETMPPSSPLQKLQFNLPGFHVTATSNMESGDFTSSLSPAAFPRQLSFE